MHFKWKRVVIREYTSIYVWLTGAVLIVMKHFYVHDDRFNLDENLTFFIVILAALLVLYLFTRYMKKAKIIVID